jgi:hypothetical protein
VRWDSSALQLSSLVICGPFLWTIRGAASGDPAAHAAVGPHWDHEVGVLYPVSAVVYKWYVRDSCATTRHDRNTKNSSATSRQPRTRLRAEARFNRGTEAERAKAHAAMMEKAAHILVAAEPPAHTQR